MGASATSLSPQHHAGSPDDATSFNHHDAAAMQNPYPFYAAIRAKCPVVRSDALGGFYLAVEHAGAKQVLSDYRHFSSTSGVALPSMGTEMYPVDLDPPMQTRFRKVLNQYFTVEAAARRRPAFERLVDGLIDAFIEVGSVDIANALTRPAINAIMLPIIGVPESDRKEFSAAIDFMSNARTSDQDRLVKTTQYVGGYLVGMAGAARRRGGAGDAFVDFIVREPIDGSVLADEDVAKVLLVVLFGALDTTHATLNEAILHLSRTPEDRERLGRDAAAWPNAIEEFVRFASPIQMLRRTTTVDLEFGGRKLNQGEPVFGVIAAGNRDPSVFADPDRCMLTRDTREHLGFGSGAHVCLGRNFARVIIEVVLTAVLTRLPDLAAETDFKPSYTAGEGRRMVALPMTFTPSRRPGAF